jgi:integrase
MKGHIRQRGKHSWELKFDAGHDPATGRRKLQYVSVKGSKGDAQKKLTELLASVGKGTFVEPNKVTVADHVRTRIAQWESRRDIGTRTAERYRVLLRCQIAAHEIGAMPLQKLRAQHIEAWHSILQASGRRDGTGLAPKTIRHAHKLLKQALDDAVKFNLVTANHASLQSPPKLESKEMVILEAEQQKAVLNGLHGHEFCSLVVTALYTGLRLGELLALRWINVDLDARVIRVREALEETRTNGIRSKETKTKAGRRDVSLPDVVVTTLRDHRRQQLELRIALGLGKMPDDALVFAGSNGEPRSPGVTSTRWGILANSLGIPAVTFHALRHTHASQLIDAGIDVVTVSKRLGHSSPNVTLQIYAHRFQKSDAKAAEAINNALGGNPS